MTLTEKLDFYEPTASGSAWSSGGVRRARNDMEVEWMADRKYSVPKRKALDDSKKATKVVDVN
jgi:hypothetical protein